MPWDSLVRTKQLHKPELSGYIVDVLLQYLKTGAVTGIAMNTGQLTGQFYPLRQNPSGYVTTGQLTGYATQLQVTGNNTYIQSWVDINYYPRSNPSGYIGAGYLSTGLMPKSGTRYAKSESFTLSNQFSEPVLSFRPENWWYLTDFYNGGESPNGSIINFYGFNGISTPYISGFDIWTTGINGQRALSSGDIDNLYVPREYFVESSSLSFPYLYLYNDNSALSYPAFLFGNDTYLFAGGIYNQPSNPIFIDMVGRSAQFFGMTYNRPLIYGLDIDTTNVTVTGFPVLTRDDLNSIASKQELYVASGDLNDDIWRLRTEMFDLLTGSGGAYTFAGTGTVTVLQSGTHVLISGAGGGSLASTGQFLTTNYADTTKVRFGSKFWLSNGNTEPPGVYLGDPLIVGNQNLVVSYGVPAPIIALNSAKIYRGGAGISPLAIDWSNGLLNTGYFESKTTVDWGHLWLGTSGLPILDWGTRTLSGTWNTQGLTVSGRPVVDSSQTGKFVNTDGPQTIQGIKNFAGGIQFLGYDALNIKSINSNSRYTFDAGETASINWSDRKLYADVGTTPVTSLNWSGRQLFVDNSTVSLDWSGRQLSGVWSAQTLVVSGYSVVTTNQTGNLGGGGGASISVSGRVVAGTIPFTGVSGISVFISGTNTIFFSAYGITSATGQFVDSSDTGQFVDSSDTGHYVTDGMTGNLAPENIGLPSDGVYGGASGPIAGITIGDRHEDAFDKIEVVLGKLAPSKPLTLGSATFGFTGVTYSANMQGTQTSFSNIMNNLQPTGYATGFYDADAGILSGYINNTFTGVRTLWTGADVGSYSGLKITNEFDYWAGSPGRAGFWNCLNAQLSPLIPANTGIIVMRMGHSQQGMTAAITGYCDTPKTATIAALSSGSGIGMCTFRWVDGIISFAAGDSVFTKFSGMNAVGPFYNANMGQLVGTPWLGATSVPATGFPMSGSHLLLSGYQSIQNNQYGTGFSITINVFNSANTTSNISMPTMFRVDTVSSQQAERRTAGTGRFLSGNFNATYDNTVNLSGNEELQMINGKLQNPPKVNYGNFIPSGRDYSYIQTGLYSGCRWAMFDMGSITSKQRVQITFNNSANFGATPIISDFLLYLRVSGAGVNATAGWINGNAAYPAVGNPTINDDPALDIGNSTATSKRITFGAASLTGPVYIRVGLPSGSNKTFGSVTMTLP